MATFKLKTPLSDADTRTLKVRDVVYISGTVVTARDQAHRRALDLAKLGKSLPMNIAGLAVFHCGPVVAKKGKKWIAIAAGPTTSTRMELYEAQFIDIFKPRIIIGKVGRGKRTTYTLARFGAAYCAFTGGADVLAAEAIKRVRGVEWLDLGIPEAMWVLEMENFGPLVVGMDAHGNNLFVDVHAKVEMNRQLMYQKLNL